MNKILIIKLGATGDVVRTTPLLRRLRGEVTWVTAAKNLVLLQGCVSGLRCLTWEQRQLAADNEYDLIINLEDTADVGAFVKGLRFHRVFGAHLDSTDRLGYTQDSREWFDLSLISVYGKQQADRLKLQNRRTYQDLIFRGLGYEFNGEKYLLPTPAETNLTGDVAIAPEAGPVWPMKNWAYYGRLKQELEARGLVVNILPQRDSLLKHLSDVRNHRCLVGGDSLPMHLALGTGTSCVTLFTCTSPWEIHDYGIQTKIISPLLPEFWYQRGQDVRAVSAISVEDVLGAVLDQLRVPVAE